MEILPLCSYSLTFLPVPGSDLWFVRPSDPALSVMTDFHEQASVTVDECLTIDAALDHMRHAGVRSAFVTTDQRLSVSGLITAYDIMGEKPMQYMSAVGITREEVLVCDVMQPVAKWHVSDIESVKGATVAAVARLFAHLPITHLPVVQTNVGGTFQLRGLFSAARIKRLLGANTMPSAVTEDLRLAS